MQKNGVEQEGKFVTGEGFFHFHHLHHGGTGERPRLTNRDASCPAFPLPIPWRMLRRDCCYWWKH